MRISDWSSDVCSSDQPEVHDAFEIGFKSRTADRLLQLNASAFYYIYKDIQLRTTAPPAPPGGTLLFNAAKAHIKGIDVDAVLAPAEGLTLTAAAEVLNAKYRSEERRVGKECVSTCRSRWWPSH